LFKLSGSPFVSTGGLFILSMGTIAWILLFKLPLTNKLQMEDLRTIDISTLIDMLSKHTADYTKMFTQGATEEEYLRCNTIIKALQKEIEFRKQSTTISANLKTDITPPPDFS
jgi:hypothetical protein